MNKWCIFHLSKLWKATFSILCDVTFLVRLRWKFDIDHSWEWKGWGCLFFLSNRPSLSLVQIFLCQRWRVTSWFDLALSFLNLSNECMATLGAVYELVQRHVFRCLISSWALDGPVTLTSIAVLCITGLTPLGTRNKLPFIGGANGRSDPSSCQ